LTPAMRCHTVIQVLCNLATFQIQPVSLVGPQVGTALTGAGPLEPPLFRRNKVKDSFVISPGDRRSRLCSTKVYIIGPILQLRVRRELAVSLTVIFWLMVKC